MGKSVASPVCVSVAERPPPWPSSSSNRKRMAGKLVFESPPLTLRAGASATASRSDALALKLALAKPFPVVVGCPRSGTSLLAVMLDSHSQLAVPPETSFLGTLAALQGTGDALRQ